jgi:GT2 family glycosyltransferase
VGFIAAANRAAEAARGEILVLLNVDALPQQGWLLPLLRVFRAFPEAGAVGSRLLTDEGRLFSAGGVLFADGSGAHLGQGDYDPDAPLYSFVRDIDYTANFALATPRQLFLDSGGLDSGYQPPSYEIVDYCFKLRANGRRIYYQPESTLLVTGSGNSCVDSPDWDREHQATNRGRFFQKWSAALSRQPSRPAQWDLPAWQAIVRLPECQEARTA